MRIDPVRLVQLYVLILGAGLLLEGGALVVLNQLDRAWPIATNDTTHNVLHVVWGLALLSVGFLSFGHDATRAVWAALVFGAFYVALGVVGLTIDRPFGMQLGPAENAFHFTVGPLALVLGAWALTSTRDRQPKAALTRIPERLTGSRSATQRKRAPRRNKSRRR